MIIVYSFVFYYVDAGTTSDGPITYRIHACPNAEPASTVAAQRTKRAFSRHNYPV